MKRRLGMERQSKPHLLTQGGSPEHEVYTMSQDARHSLRTQRQSARTALLSAEGLGRFLTICFVVFAVALCPLSVHARVSSRLGNKPGDPEMLYQYGIDFYTNISDTRSPRFLHSIDVRGLMIDQSGKILVTGSGIDTNDSRRELFLARSLQNGMLDPTFGLLWWGDEHRPFVASIDNGEFEVASAIVDSRDRVVLGMTFCYSEGFYSDRGACEMAAIRIKNDGSDLDPAFGRKGVVRVPGQPGERARAVAIRELKVPATIEPDPPLAIVGVANHDIKLAFHYNLEDATTDPALLTSTDVYQGTDDSPEAVSLTSDGRVVVGVTSIVPLGHPLRGEGRFLPILIRYKGGTSHYPGHLDSISSVLDGPTHEDVRIGAMAVDSEARAVVALNHRVSESVTTDGQRFPAEDWVWLYRMQVDGNRDHGFPPSEAQDDLGYFVYPLLKHFRVQDMVIDPKGRIVLLGSQTQNDVTLVRLHSDGRVDYEFGDPFLVVHETLTAPVSGKVTIDAEGRIVVAYSGEISAGRHRINLGRLFSEVGPEWWQRRPCLVCSTSGAVCGNGAIELGEQCDGGNNVPGDGCSPTCQIEDDRDGDGRFDPDDFCVNVGGARDFARPKLTLSGMDTTSVDSISFKGEMRLAPGTSLASFDPNQVDGGNGVTFVVTNGIPSQRWGALLGGTYGGPGTSGWRRVGSSWRFYGNPANPDHGGITRLTIVDRSSIEPGRVKVTIAARKASLRFAPIGPADSPLQAFLILGRYGEAATRGECGETRFTTANCEFNSAGTQATCRK